MTIQVTLFPGLILEIEGEYTKAEPEVGLNESFEAGTMKLIEGDAFELIEWTEAQHGSALTKIDELCLEKINDK